MYVLQNKRIVEREITYTPGLYKIFDEIVVNASDNKQVRALSLRRGPVRDLATSISVIYSNQCSDVKF
jgi:hypothetical protein